MLATTFLLLMLPACMSRLTLAPRASGSRISPCAIIPGWRGALAHVSARFPRAANSLIVVQLISRVIVLLGAINKGLFLQNVDAKLQGGCGRILSNVDVQALNHQGLQPRRRIQVEDETHHLVIEKTISRDGCVVHDLPATGTFLTGKENVLLAGEAGGFNRSAEGITSALLTGKAAAEAILKSLETGVDAAQWYRDAARQESQKCERVYDLLEEKLGINPFRRDVRI